MVAMAKPGRPKKDVSEHAVTVSFSIPPSGREKLLRLAKASGMSPSRYLVELIGKQMDPGPLPDSEPWG